LDVTTDATPPTVRVHSRGSVAVKPLFFQRSSAKDADGAERAAVPLCAMSCPSDPVSRLRPGPSLLPQRLCGRGPPGIAAPGRCALPGHAPWPPQQCRSSAPVSRPPTKSNASGFRAGGDGRQRRFRARQQKVTHQGSASVRTAAVLAVTEPPPGGSPSAGPEPGRGTHCCHRCARPISPFLRRDFLRSTARRRYPP